MRLGVASRTDARLHPRTRPLPPLVRVPGTGAVYVSQTLQFKAPVFVDDTVTARVEVTKVDPARRLVTLATSCRKADGTVVIQGEAVALVPKS